MSLNTSLSVASSGLSAVQYELAVASQNVANASTPGYVAEIANVASRDAGGQGGGVVIQLTTRAVNDALQASLYAQNARVAGLNVTVNALNAVGAVQGSTSANPTASNTLSDNLGNLQNSFTALDADPSSVVNQKAVISSANLLASSIQTSSGTYQAQRQSAQQAMPAEIGAINSNLNSIGSISKQIMQLRAAGQDTADLENQRSAAMDTLSSSLGVKFTETSAGDMLVSLANGTSLPTHATTGPLSLSSMQTAVIGATDLYSYPTTVAVPPASAPTIPGIELNGQDVTASLTGGALGANITLRDITLPTMQSQLDTFSSIMANRFSEQGLTLFTDASGNSPGNATASAPPGGQLGFSTGIKVSSAVVATPSQVRDGDPARGLNPSGAVGYTGLISAVLNATFASPSDGTGELATLATTLTATQAQTIATATTQQATQTDIQTTLAANLTATSGVSVDGQMAKVVALQNAYESNAKVVAAVQSMFAALLAAVT